MYITVTLAASAYQELRSNETKLILFTEINDVVEVPKSVGIGQAVVFLQNGNSINVVESKSEIQKELFSIVSGLFVNGFSKN